MIRTSRGNPLSATALIIALTVVSWFPTRPGEASMLFAVATGAPDSATNGAFVAQPATPDGALYANPAGLVAFERTTYSGSLGVVFPHTRVESDLVGYAESDHRVAMAPSGAVSFAPHAGWRLGFGLYGNVGTVFDFEAEPPNVPSDFVSEVSVVALPLAIAHELTPRLWLGAELVPLFGYQRNRFTLLDESSGTALPLKYTLRGPGVQAMVGATWLPSEKWSLGLGVRTPGKIWLDGSTVLGAERVDVDLELRMPTVIWGGITRHFTKKLDVSASVRWTDSSVFGDSDVEFAASRLPFVPDAKDEWRVALGAAYDITEALTLRVGAGYASRIVGNKGVSPLLFDGEDIKISGGLSYTWDAWTLHFMAGHQFEEKRKVSADDALILPGEYTASGPIVMLGMTYQRSARER